MNNIDIGRSDLTSWEAAKPKNYFLSDSNMRTVQGMYLGDDYREASVQLERTGELAAVRMNRLAMESNRDENLPVLRRYNAAGENVEEVVFHPDYHELGMLVWGTGVLSLLVEPGNEVECGGLIYFMAHNGEAGHMCPLACTIGAIKLLQQLGTSEQKVRYLPRLLERSYANRLHASQFITEVQGGSDVGSNACCATSVAGRPGDFLIHGEKWFCSVIDAGLFVVTARPEGAVDGTKGLGLFLIPRVLENGLNHFSIRRLKYKLGTRSMATGEMEIHGALAEQIGPLEQGFKNVVSIVLDTSRVYNAVCACGMMRRAYVEAQTFAWHRKAFGRRILDFPLVRKTLARMKAETCATIATTFRILNMTDRIATGNGTPDLIAARRIQVSINKYWTAIRCTETVRNGIEILGGNGTVEDFSVLPRLYRDSIVIESWEGTHNTLCAQVLRDFATRGMHKAWIEDIRETIGRVQQASLAFHRERAMVLADEVADRIQRILAGDETRAVLLIRSVIDQMCVLSSYVSMMRELDWEIDHGGGEEKQLLVDLYRRYYIDVIDPLEDTESAEMERMVTARV